MSDRADVIFIGQVMAVRRPVEIAGVIEIDFRIDQALRGCSGSVYTLREWSGLWVVSDQRYHTGQRMLMLLHSPSAAGLSSPVDGLDGAIPIRQGGSTTPYRGQSASAQIVDLRWLGAKLPRTMVYQGESSAQSKLKLPAVPFVADQPVVVAARPGAAVSAAAIVPLSASAVDNSVPAQQASVEAIVGMLNTWEKARHVTP
jgi:hypothetical protein